MLNDYVLIEELAWLSQEERLLRIQALADDAARQMKQSLDAALERHDHVLVATHVPPFREACWYQGAISNDDYLPHFSSKASGDALLETLERRPGKELLVLCGHTHGAGWTQPLPNLQVRTGGAEYGRPAIQEILRIE
jgi:predicted phosphohydrolase